MFNWRVKEMALINAKKRGTLWLGKEMIYPCESEVSREDKIAFVDSMQDGKLSYLLSLIEKFEAEKDSLPHESGLFSDRVKTVSLKSWIKRNDKKYRRPIIDDWCKYGRYYLLGCERDIQINNKGQYDTYEDLVDEVFHRQLKKCEELEKEYFVTHDEYSVLKNQLHEYTRKYDTTFGVLIGFYSDRKVVVYKDENFDNKREITIEELNDLISKYKKLDDLVDKLTSETTITF